MFYRLSNKIEAKMRDEGVTRFPSFEFLLYLLSRINGTLINLRTSCYQRGILKSKKLPCLVISIGNITVGGTGKTPLVIYVSKLIKQLGYRVTVLSRGYKGGAERSGGIVSDGQTVLMKPEQAGDEPFMMANILENIPVVVGRKRFDAGMVAVKAFDPDVIVLDDGFQHLSLARDLDLVLLDSQRPFGNAHLFPRGTLREPVAGLSRGGAFILTRYVSDDLSTFDRIKTMMSPKPVFRSFHIPQISRVISATDKNAQKVFQKPGGYDFESLKKYRIFAFSGIAQNEDFKHMLLKQGLEINRFMGFADHYYYSDEELKMIMESAMKSDCDKILTTDKDFARISGRIHGSVELVVVGIETSFCDETDGFDHFIASRLRERITLHDSGH